jgi:hypothetical protein
MLLMACVFMGGWLRSAATTEGVHYTSHGIDLTFISHNRAIVFIYIQKKSVPVSYGPWYFRKSLVHPRRNDVVSASLFG